MHLIPTNVFTTTMLRVQFIFALLITSVKNNEMWFVGPYPSCLSGNQDLSISNIPTIELCMEECFALRNTLPCRSVDFHTTTDTCVLSKANRASAQYLEPCNVLTVQYAEYLGMPALSPLDSKDKECSEVGSVTICVHLF